MLMKKIFVFITCFFIISFVSCKQTICYACKSHKGFKSFVELLSKQTGIIVIQDNWDLSVDKVKAVCKNEIIISGNKYYIPTKSIKIEEGQILIIPRGCFFIPNTRDRVVANNYYEASKTIHGYLASKERTTIKSVLTEKVLLPPNSILRFKKGKIKNGVIDMASGSIESNETHIIDNCILSNLGNKKVFGRWFLNDNQIVSTIDFKIFDNKEVDFGNLRLYANDAIKVPNAHWSHLYLIAPQIIIGNYEHLKSDFPIWKTSSKSPSRIETDVNLSSYKDYIILLSFAEPVHYDWREEHGKPTLFRGVTSLIESAQEGLFTIQDSVEVFKRDYQYRASDGSQTALKSKGYIYQPCNVIIDSCCFYSSQKTNSGFMYIYSGKDIHLNNSSWIASSDGTPSLLGINNSVNGVVEHCLFKGAFYPGTKTSYGLQTFNSTRITIKDCILEGNRRGVDFSGSLCQSRYCVVEDCKVVGDIIEKEGSGLGGHSTSYGNIYRNNIIEGSSSCAGIQTRGDHEIIEGNIFMLPFTAAAISCAENTTIRNNICDNGKTSTFVWIESISKKGNTIIVENNKFEGNNFVRGQKQLTCKVIINGNTFKYASTVSSFAPTGNEVIVSSYNNKIMQANNKAVLYYKYNTTSSQSKSENLGPEDRADFSVDKLGVVSHTE